MASWKFPSQLFLVVLFSWSVGALPTQSGWNAEVNPGSQNTKAEGLTQTVQGPAKSSVSWIVARPKSKNPVVQHSIKARPSLTQANSPLNPEGPSVLWAAKTSEGLPPSVPENSRTSWEVGSQIKLFPTPSPDDHVGFPEAFSLPQDPEDLAALPVAGTEQSLPPPPSNPDGPAVSWLVDPDVGLYFPSNPEMPSLSWRVGLRKKFPPPPPVSEKSADKWLAGLIKNVPEMEQVDKPSNSEDANAKWMVRPPKRELLESPQGPAASSVGVNMEEQKVDPSSSVVDPFSASPMEGFSFTPDLNFLLESEEPLTEQKGLELGVTKGETEPLEKEPLPLEYPESFYLGGELSNLASIYEDGNSEQEIKDFSLVPSYPLSAERDYLGVMPLPYGRPVVPNLFYLFLTGQLPHGTVSHIQTDYEVGGDHATHVGYESFPSTEGTGTDHQMKAST
ncbi:PREDICTED: uncharacterized protein LOC107084686 [Cyprinodon variegatus]|uniref:uncharacterized protein LOC107084686 n=1 Tax=Cyprinodon variegatus TaxID=28743 RepID=UPI000742C909|nr:PREDICTED: uncharacterized protein LOC107084686 [Cyprinodon variegatus]